MKFVLVTGASSFILPLLLWLCVLRVLINSLAVCLLTFFFCAIVDSIPGEMSLSGIFSFTGKGKKTFPNYTTLWLSKSGG